MSPGLVLLTIIVVLLVGALPRWPYSRDWGYAPVGSLSLLGLVVAVVLVMNWV